MTKVLSNEHWKQTFPDVDAFLYGELDKMLFMICPPGYLEVINVLIEEQIDLINAETFKQEIKYIMLKKSIYGLVQAARTWWRNLWKVLEGMRFKNA